MFRSLGDHNSITHVYACIYSLVDKTFSVVKVIFDVDIYNKQHKNIIIRL